MKISGHMFFGAQIQGMVSDFRSDESFPVKTGSCRKIMVDPLIEQQWEGQSGSKLLLRLKWHHLWIFPVILCFSRNVFKSFSSNTSPKRSKTVIPIPLDAIRDPVSPQTEISSPISTRSFPVLSREGFWWNIWSKFKIWSYWVNSRFYKSLLFDT